MTHIDKFMGGLESELSESLKQKVVQHKQNFVKLFYQRYKELLPSLIMYDNADLTSIDFLKVEVALRNGYNVVIGEVKNREKLQVIGYTNTLNTDSDPKILFDYSPLTKKDINFIIPKDLQKEKYHEITRYDDCKTGNFIVLKNKAIQYIDDFSIIQHYTQELAEINISRYSIAIQSKLNTIFLDDVGNESINQLVSDLYNGTPYIKISDLFDPNDQIFQFENNNIASNFAELKREYQNRIAELNNMIGIQSLAVEKSSGVSDTEAKSNRAYTTVNANIYLDARNNPLNKLNTRYKKEFDGKEISALYNDEVHSQFSEIAYADTNEVARGVGGSGENNSDNIRFNQT